jgi:hypothetical protein
VAPRSDEQSVERAIDLALKAGLAVFLPRDQRRVRAVSSNTLVGQTRTHKLHPVQRSELTISIMREPPSYGLPRAGIDVGVDLLDAPTQDAMSLRRVGRRKSSRVCMARVSVRLSALAQAQRPMASIAAHSRARTKSRPCPCR